MAQTNLPFPKLEVGMTLYAKMPNGVIVPTRVGQINNARVMDQNNNKYYKEIKVSFHKFYLKPYEEVRHKDLPWLWFPTDELMKQYDEQELRKVVRPKLNNLFGEWDNLSLEQLKRLNAFLDDHNIDITEENIEKILVSKSNHSPFGLKNQDGKYEAVYSISSIIKTIRELTGASDNK
jgi:hypothetical protein